MTETIQVYQTDRNGVFVGVTEADESPLEPGVFHLPGGCVEEVPPAFGEGERARWADGAWVVEPIPDAEPEPEPPEPTEDDYRRAIQFNIDATAKSRGYENGVNLASYVNSTIEAWAAEARAFVAWRDAVWVYVNAQLVAVLTGARAQPTIAELMNELPPMEWPE